MIKAFFEVYKVLNKLGIKPKDVIGMGGDIVKMGKSLFNTRINPKLLTFIEKNQKIPTKILEEIKLHARTLKNASESQKNLFLENIKSIEKAKTVIKPEIVPKKGMFDNIFTKMHREVMGPPKVVKPPVTGVQKPATSDKGIKIIHNLSRKLALKAQKGKDTLPTAWQAEGHAGSIGARVQQVKGWNLSQIDKFIKSEKQLSKILDDWAYGASMTKQSFKKPPATGIEKVIDFKGWKPTVIKGGKDKLATGGRVGYATKGKVSLSDLESLKGLKKSEGDGKGILGAMAGRPMGVGREAAKKQRDSIQNKVIGTFVNSLDKLDQETSTYVKSLFNDAIQVGYETDMSGLKTEVFEKTGIIPINAETIYNAIISLDLPQDIKTEMSLFADAAGNEEIEAAMKRNDMGLTWNNDTQEIQADFTFVIGTDGNTRISPIITKDEDSQIKKELKIEHAFDSGALNFSIDKNTLDNAKNMEINYAGDGVSLYAQTAKDDDRNIFQTGTTLEIPFYLLNKDEKPYISAELYKDMDSDFEAKQFSGVLPIWDGLSAYASRYEDTDGQWNETDYGLSFEKSGGLDNKFFSNILKKDYTRDESQVPEGYWNIGADINKDKEWNIMAGITIPLGGSDDRRSKPEKWYEKSQIKDHVKDKETGELVYYSERDQLKDKVAFENQDSNIYSGSDASEAYKAYKEKKEEFATGGIANHFRKR